MCDDLEVVVLWMHDDTETDVEDIRMFYENFCESDGDSPVESHLDVETYPDGINLGGFLDYLMNMNRCVSSRLNPGFVEESESFEDDKEFYHTESDTFNEED